MYNPDDLVLIKLKQNLWWPAQVVEPENSAILVLSPRDFICHVKFLEENKYKEISKEEIIKFYDCPDREEVIQLSSSILKRDKTVKGVNKLLTFNRDLAAVESMRKLLLGLHVKTGCTSDDESDQDGKATTSSGRTYQRKPTRNATKLLADVNQSHSDVNLNDEDDSNDLPILFPKRTALENAKKAKDSITDTAVPETTKIQKKNVSRKNAKQKCDQNDDDLVDFCQINEKQRTTRSKLKKISTANPINSKKIKADKVEKTDKCEEDEPIKLSFKKTLCIHTPPPSPYKTRASVKSPCIKNVRPSNPVFSNSPVISKCGNTFDQSRDLFADTSMSCPYSPVIGAKRGRPKTAISPIKLRKMACSSSEKNKGISQKECSGKDIAKIQSSPAKEVSSTITSFQSSVNDSDSLMGRTYSLSPLSPPPPPSESDISLNSSIPVFSPRRLRSKSSTNSTSTTTTPANLHVAKKRGRRKGSNEKIKDSLGDLPEKSFSELKNASYGHVEDDIPGFPIDISTPLYKANDVDGNDSSDDSVSDLPDVFNTSSLNQAFPAKYDVVWAQVRGFSHWPAVVRNTSHKKKKLYKISVIFFGTEKIGLTFTYDKKKILPFNTPRHEEFVEQGRNVTTDNIDIAVTMASDFMTKVGLGGAPSSQDIFGGVDFEGIQFEDESNVPNRPSTSASAIDNSSVIEIGTVDSSMEDCVLDDSQQSIVTSPVRLRLRKRQNKVLDYMMTEDTKEYLYKIYTGEASSDRHVEFNAGCKRRNKLKRLDSIGPIENEDELEAVRRKMTTWIEALKTGQHPFLDFDYVVDVWIPEAAIFAYHKTENVSWKKARDWFDTGIKYTKRERERLHKQILESAKNIDPEDKEHYDMLREIRLKEMKEKLNL